MAHLFDQPSNKHTVTWQPEPDVRGTFNILSTCTITILLGIWSVVQLNRPWVGWDEAFERYFPWILASLFAPESSIVVAWSQRQAANRVQKKVDEVFSNRAEPSNDNIETQSSPRKHKWTKTHSYWAISGGIALDIHEFEPLYHGRYCPTLTENGVLLLLKTDPELLPDIPESEIRDVSKHHSLGRSLAIIQAVWFCIACIVRVGQQFSLSLLELHTFVHATCTIIVYIIWWKKPLGVKRQSLITSDRIRPLLAFMWMASRISARGHTKEDLDDTERNYTYSDAPEFEAIYLGKFCEDTRVPSIGSSRSVDAEPATVEVTPERGLEGTNFFVNGSSARWTVKSETITTEDGPPVERNTRKDPAVFVLDATAVRRWRLAYEAINQYALRKPTVNHGYITTDPIPEHIDSVPSEWTDDDLASGLKTLGASLGLFLFGSAVGTLYALAWNTQFPSRTQRIMWRISSLVVACTAGGALGVFCAMILGQLMMLALPQRRPKSISTIQTTTKELQATAASDEKVQNPPPARRLARFGSSILESSTWKVVKSIAKVLYNAALQISLYLWSLTYVLSRAYLVGESFRMVFYLPPDALRATPWEKYFPHIG